MVKGQTYIGLVSYTCGQATFVILVLKQLSRNDFTDVCEIVLGRGKREIFTRPKNKTTPKHLWLIKRRKKKL